MNIIIFTLSCVIHHFILYRASTLYIDKNGSHSLSRTKTNKLWYKIYHKIEYCETVFLLFRTLCIPPFFKHKTDELNQSVSAELRIDKNVLSKFLTICTEEELPSKCPQIDSIWLGSSNIVCGLALQKRYNVFIEQTGMESWYSVSYFISTVKLHTNTQLNFINTSLSVRDTRGSF